MLLLLVLSLFSHSYRSEPVAKVAGRTIYRDEIPLRTSLDAYLKRLVFFELAKEKGYDDSVRASVERGFKETLVKELYYRIIKDSKPSSAEPFILNRLLGKEVQVKLIQTNDFKTAWRAWEEVMRGGDFGDVSENYSTIIRLKNEKGDIGWVRWRFGASPILKKVFRMKEGEVSFPFKSEDSWSVIKVLEIRDGEVQDFSNIENGLSNQIKKVKADFAANDHINYVKWILGVQVDPEGLRLLASRVPRPTKRTREGLKPEFKLEDMDKVLARSALGTYKVRDFALDIKAMRQLPQFSNREETEGFIEWRVIFDFLLLEAKRLGIFRRADISKDFKEQLIRAAVPRWKAFAVKPFTHCTDEERLKYFEENREKYRVQEKRKVYVIEVTTKQEVDEIRGELQRGESFEELASHKSIGPEKTKGGLMGYIEKGTNGTIGDVAFKLKLGRISKPVKRDEHWAIVKVTDIKESHIPLYPELRYRLNRDYEDDKREEIENKIFEENKDRLGVLVLEEVKE